MIIEGTLNTTREKTLPGLFEDNQPARIEEEAKVKQACKVKKRARSLEDELFRSILPIDIEEINERYEDANILINI